MTVKIEERIKQLHAQREALNHRLVRVLEAQSRSEAFVVITQCLPLSELTHLVETQERRNAVKG